MLLTSLKRLNFLRKLTTQSVFHGRIQRFCAGTGTRAESYQHNDENVIKASEKKVFEGYRDIVQKTFLMPNGSTTSYDIVTQKHLSVVVFIWNTATSTTTLIREFHPGVEKFMYGTVAGMYETSKHSSPLHASQLELEEEAHLRTEQWIPLLDSADTSMSFDKYSTNKFYPFLALNCAHVDNPLPADNDELISIEHKVSYSKMMELITSGQMNVVSTYAIMMGVHKLQKMGIKLEAL